MKSTNEIDLTYSKPTGSFGTNAQLRAKFDVDQFTLVGELVFWKTPKPMRA
ncbi:hypothetical protein [Gleimia hominis]|uniref:hypothetical protein n=1 Tax=Gleimia hominis TaxID=595468 RepID=UPI001304738E|nr:hypothetical protein [Gleimia hominis]WIK64916.1 hypothetical protein CJ187_002355 [Gleimia hominis]